MCNRLVIIGAGGYGKVIVDNALKNGYTDIIFVDDNLTGECMGIPIVGTCAEIEKLNNGKTDFVIAIGDNFTRKIIAERYNVNWVTLVHPCALISVNVSIGIGTVIMANTVINAGARIGNHCILNTASVIEHDNTISDYVHISPKVALGGTVNIGACTHIGIGANVINNINICGGCVVGAGATVVQNIEAKGTYVGVPARKVK